MLIKRPLIFCLSNHMHWYGQHVALYAKALAG
uniref:Uncharacterized protein n=1 Tax=Rhizophora mucronata TaxID=61149 RepID=A0A2P2IP58_RHIMU